MQIAWSETTNGTPHRSERHRVRSSTITGLLQNGYVQADFDACSENAGRKRPGAVSAATENQRTPRAATADVLNTRRTSCSRAAR